MKIKKNEKAITIIALIISMMILLIIAGVATSKLSDMRGIVNQSKDASKLISSAVSDDVVEKNETNSDAISYVLK